MRKKKNRIKALILAVMLIACEVCSLFPTSQTEMVYAATGGQTSSSDVLNVVLTTSGTVPATMGGLSESTYVATNNTAGQQRGTIALDNSSVGGYMHVNIGQTIDMYAPSADVDYTDVIGFSGNYTFKAAGGRGGTIVAKDTNVSNDVTVSRGGYGSVITNSKIDYNTGQSITYRLGSNGSNTTGTNTTYWNHLTNTATLKSYMGNINAGLCGETNTYKAYSVSAQSGTASYIQVSGNKYIVAGGGSPGVVMFHCNSGVYSADGTNGVHADESDISKLIPNGYDGFANPGSDTMSVRYRDYGTYGSKNYNPNNINAGRIVGTTAKQGIPFTRASGGGVAYEDMFYGWVCTPADNILDSLFTLSKVYPGYSGLASRSGSVFSTQGLSDSAYSVSIDSSATQSSPYLKLTCNAKYITIANPTRRGYTFTGWTCGNGVSVVSNNGSSYRFKVTSSGATITATWVANNYTITYNGNGADNGTTASQTCRFDTTYTLNANGFTKVGYLFEGWATSPDGDVVYADRVSVRNLTTADNGNVTLYAKWKAVEYTIAFDANGGTGTLESITTHYDEDVTLPDGTSDFVKYTLDGVNVTADVLAGNMIPAENAGDEADDTAKAYASVFLGWALEDEKDLLEPRWTAGETVRNLTEQDGGVVTLYAVWDDCPWIQATDLYYTLEQAQSGFITADEILSHMTASDREDGSPILPGTHDNGTSFTIPDYAPTDFTQFDGDGSCTENLTVVDSAGSVYVKQITVYVVDTTPKPIKPEGTTRFINEYYYNQPYELGGLADDSIWKTDPEYIAEIQTAFDNLRNDTPQEVYHFTHEQILEMKEFVSEHGIGKSKEPDALSKFYDEFMAPNRVK